MPETDPFAPENRIKLLTTAGRCRSFLLKYAPRGDWASIAANGGWGAHLHNAVFKVALSDKTDGEEVDLIEPLIDLVIEDWGDRLPLYMYGEDERRAAYAIAAESLNQVDFDQGDPIAAWEAAAAYAREKRPKDQSLESQ